MSGVAGKENQLWGLYSRGSLSSRVLLSGCGAPLPALCMCRRVPLFVTQPTTKQPPHSSSHVPCGPWNGLATRLVVRMPGDGEVCGQLSHSAFSLPKHLCSKTWATHTHTQLRTHTHSPHTYTQHVAMGKRQMRRHLPALPIRCLDADDFPPRYVSLSALPSSSSSCGTPQPVNLAPCGPSAAACSSSLRRQWRLPCSALLPCCCGLAPCTPSRATPAHLPIHFILSTGPAT